jgi:uncharacterized lipoprotein YajG
MKKNKIISIIGFVAIYLMVASCKAPAITQVADTKVLPSMYVKSKDTTNAADMNWKDFFNDKNLISLIILGTRIGETKRFSPKRQFKKHQELH